MAARLPYLQQRKAGYYYRQRIPLALKPIFPNREIIASLKTRCPKQARVRAMTLFASVNALFEEVKGLGQTIEHAEAKKIAENWRKRTLNEDLERKIFGEYDLTPQQPTEVIEDNLRNMDLRMANDLVSTVARDANLDIEPDGKSWQMLAFQLMRAQLLARDEIREREKSAYRHADFYELEELNQTQGTDLRVSVIFEQWLNAKKRGENTLKEWKAAIRRFIELKGDIDVRTITKADIRAYREACKAMPVRLSHEDRQLPILELLGKYQHTDVRRVNPKSALKYLTALKSILGFAVREGYLDDNPASGITIEIVKSTSDRRMPFEGDDLYKIFRGSPVYRADVRPKGGAGEAAYWMPLLALYTGARLEELGQLRVTDVRQENGIHYLDINEEDGKRLKTLSSARRIPLHDDLLHAGFLEEVERQRSAGSKHLFPHLLHDLPKCTHGFSKWVNRYISTTCGIEDRRKVFHSFRHTFKDACRDAEIELAVHDALTGHTDGSVGGSYGLGFTLERLHRAINRIKYPTVGVPRRPDVLNPHLG
jgi:integrase